MANSITHKLQAIWQELLEVDGVSLSDNFFTLGGDSILALTVVDRARAAGLEISVRQVLECPVLGDLVSRVAEGADAGR